MDKVSVDTRGGRFPVYTNKRALCSLDEVYLSGEGQRTCLGTTGYVRQFVQLLPRYRTPETSSASGPPSIYAPSLGALVATFAAYSRALLTETGQEGTLVLALGLINCSGQRIGDSWKPMSPGSPPRPVVTLDATADRTESIPSVMKSLLDRAFNAFGYADCPYVDAEGEYRGYLTMPLCPNPTRLRTGLPLCLLLPIEAMPLTQSDDSVFATGLTHGGATGQPRYTMVATSITQGDGDGVSCRVIQGLGGHPSRVAA